MFTVAVPLVAVAAMAGTKAVVWVLLDDVTVTLPPPAVVAAIALPPSIMPACVTAILALLAALVIAAVIAAALPLPTMSPVGLMVMLPLVELAVLVTLSAMPDSGALMLPVP